MRFQLNRLGTMPIVRLNIICQELDRTSIELYQIKFIHKTILVFILKPINNGILVEFCTLYILLIF